MIEYLALPSAAPVWCEIRGPSPGRGRNSVYPVSDFLKRFGYNSFCMDGQHLVPFLWVRIQLRKYSIFCLPFPNATVKPSASPSDTLSVITHIPRKKSLCLRKNILRKSSLASAVLTWLSTVSPGFHRPEDFFV